ncbi:MAG: hypothetical protein LBI13_00090 [Streptococcaceae bacterium]|jgi:uncharacterized protein YukE|nr:hypothetical protein [Streptococcaceae bacterium]
MIENTLTEKTQDSLGFIHLSIALKNVFNLDILSTWLVQRRDDDFDCFTEIEGKKVAFTIGDTRTEGMMFQGPGGAFGIALFSKDDWGVIIAPNGDEYNFLHNFVSPEEADYLKHKGYHGKDENAIEKSLLILKRYLTHNFLYIQAKEKIEAALQNIVQMNQTVESEWKGQIFKDYLETYQQLEETMADFVKLLEKGDALLQEYEEENGPIKNKDITTTNTVIARVQQVKSIIDTPEAKRKCKK